MSPLTPGSTTWLFVRTWPLPSMTKPEPVAGPSLPPSTLIVTTLGSATAAMLATDPAGRCVAPGPGSGSVDPVTLTRSPASWPATPPTTPESRQRPTTARTTLPRPRGRPGGAGASVSRTPGEGGPPTVLGSPVAGAWGTGPAYAVPAPAGTSLGCASPGPPAGPGVAVAPESGAEGETDPGAAAGGAYAERCASSARASARSLPHEASARAG